MSETLDSLRAVLEERLPFETIVADLSAQFVNLDSDLIDGAIQDAQRRIVEALDLDRSSLFQFSAVRRGWRGVLSCSRPRAIDVTRDAKDMGHFRAPTLRNIAVTAPYMHDGTIPTLEGVLDHYASGGHASRFRSRAVRGFTLSAGERADLLEFLNSLTDETFLADPAFARPR